jgi:hypothetical protein
MAIVQDFRFRSQAALDEHVKKNGASFGGYLYLTGCTSLTSLPDGLTVGGSLYLTGCTSLTSLPDGLTVGGSLDLTGCTSLTSLPDGLTVGGSLDLTGCKIAPKPSQEHRPIKRVCIKSERIIWPFIARRNFGSSAYFLLIYNPKNRAFDLLGDPQRYAGEITECIVLPTLKSDAVEELRALLTPEDLAAAAALSIKTRNT